jgi:WD40 repeat protein
VITLTTEDADTLVFSPDGRWLAANPGVFPSPGSSLVVWDTKTWAVAASITPQRDPHQGAPVQWIAFGGAQPGQKQLSYAQGLRFAADGKTQTVWYGVGPLAVSPDGKLLAELGQRSFSDVELWDTNTGQKLQAFAAHKMVTNSLAFSRDGRWLLTTGQESQRTPVDPHTFTGTTEYTVKVWDARTWKERTSVSYPHVLTLSAVLSPTASVSLSKGLGELSSCWTWRVGRPPARSRPPLRHRTGVRCLERATWRSAPMEPCCLRARSRTASTFGSLTDFKTPHSLRVTG